MMRLRSIALLLLALALGLLMLVTAGHAQDLDTPEVNSVVEIQFGISIDFSISIETEVEPARAVIFIRTSPTAQYDAHIVRVDQSDKTTASITFEPQALNLLPFKQIDFYWQVDLADGVVLTSKPEQITYLDPRYEWKELNGDGVTIHWVVGDITWAQDLVAIANSVLPQIQSLLAVPATEKFFIYVYPSKAELQNSLRQAGISQASAHALYELGVVLVAGENDPENLIRLEQEIPHELAHVLLYQRMGSQIDDAPVWLNEGLATLHERSPRPIYKTALESAVNAGSLIEIESLCSSFPIAEEARILAYAQSASFTNYLIDIYGTGGILLLLDAYEEGTSCTGGIQRVYQRPLKQLESEWMDTVIQQTGFNLDDTLILFALVSALGIALGAILLVRSRYRNKLQT